MVKRIDKYNTTKLKKYYKDYVEKSSDSLEELSAFRVNYEYGNFFDTSIIKYTNNTVISKVSDQYIAKHGGWGNTSEEQVQKIQTINETLRNHNNLLLVSTKRTSDYIRKYARISKTLAEYIVKVNMFTTLNFDEDYSKIAELITLTSETYQHAQLDLITLKAIAYYTPMPEIYLVIEQYQNELDYLLNKWNEIENLEKYNLPKFKEEYINFSELIYKEHGHLFKTRELLLQNVDYFIVNYLEHEYVTTPMVEGGGFIDK
ncbi:hypothetical protein [Macrococcoides caseolyticum]|uniref:hypothetical protein n=1 Tax=Macrococcoides caseolyticum TaxID=69966 RepID=UPI000C329CCC|nr:hypothetical protein [Macrococcus caseolyticus]PKE20733.1 hypothetical protein CW688_11010 [Macrococcus caseolyticus]PKE71380.1 hypothetical protein CW665_10835 [Macrococcus caseolyticus]PKF05333.1 hypothetical protein CW698_10575 [Macrococcus caseolyticus]